MEKVKVTEADADELVSLLGLPKTAIPKIRRAPRKRRVFGPRVLSDEERKRRSDRMKEVRAKWLEKCQAEGIAPNEALKSAGAKAREAKYKVRALTRKLVLSPYGRRLIQQARAVEMVQGAAKKLVDVTIGELGDETIETMVDDVQSTLAERKWSVSAPAPSNPISNPPAVEGSNFNGPFEVVSAPPFPLLIRGGANRRSFTSRDGENWKKFRERLVAERTWNLYERFVKIIEGILATLFVAPRAATTGAALFIASMMFRKRHTTGINLKNAGSRELSMQLESQFSQEDIWDSLVKAGKERTCSNMTTWSWVCDNLDVRPGDIDPGTVPSASAASLLRRVQNDYEFSQKLVRDMATDYLRRTLKSEEKTASASGVEDREPSLAIGRMLVELRKDADGQKQAMDEQPAVAV